MRIGDNVEIKPYRTRSVSNAAHFAPVYGEVVDIRGILFKRYTVAFLFDRGYDVVSKLCVMRRGQLSPLYGAPVSEDGFKYGA